MTEPRGLLALRKGRKRIEQGWTQRINARDVKGNPVPADSDKAVCWCAVGAIAASCGTYEEGYIPALRAMENVLMGSGHWDSSCVAAWNDEPRRTKEEVLALYDRTIGSFT